MRLDHALKSAGDLVLEGTGAGSTALLVVVLLAVGENLPASQAHLRVELRDDWLGLWVLEKD